MLFSIQVEPEHKRQARIDKMKGEWRKTRARELRKGGLE